MMKKEKNISLSEKIMLALITISFITPIVLFYLDVALVK